MVSLYNINNIYLGQPSHSGHETYPDAVYYPPHNKAKAKKIVYKKNRNGNPQYSRLEIAFSQLARLFMSDDTTPDQKLVVDDSINVVGLVIQHLCYVIEQNEGLSQPFYSLKYSRQDFSFKKKNVKVAEKIPLYFLDKLPHEFFNNLLDAEQLNILSIDYSSLASIFAASYTLEEDDLHKGNFGFYLVENEGKPRVVFFKIDHDLMFADSIMSFYCSRPSHWSNGDNAFDITAYDLLNFPNIKDSLNSYWPTKISFFPNPWGNKEYQNEEEVNAFAQLKDNPEFNKAKWMSFYKHILVPTELIERSLSDCLDVNNAYERAQIALITQATVARQAQLRAVLFSLKEFRNFVTNLTKEEKNFLLKEVLHSYTADDRNQLVAQVETTLFNQQKLCQLNNIDEKDTPLHIAIKMGDYRYEETIEKYGHLINTKNNQGLTPLDLAVQMMHSADPPVADPRKDLRFTMRHLLEHGAKQSKAFKSFNSIEHIETYRFHTSYLDRTVQAKSYNQFKDILRDIGEDHRFCLKYKKNLAIECISKYTKENRSNPNYQQLLLQLKRDVNGQSKSSQGNGLQYIRQLRSRLWIIRLIRGLFGWTSTQGEINSIIDSELERVKPKEWGCCSFFANTPTPESDKELILPERNELVI